MSSGVFHVCGGVDPATASRNVAFSRDKLISLENDRRVRSGALQTALRKLVGQVADGCRLRIDETDAYLASFEEFVEKQRIYDLKAGSRKSSLCQTNASLQQQQIGCGVQEDLGSPNLQAAKPVRHVEFCSGGVSGGNRGLEEVSPAATTSGLGSKLVAAAACGTPFTPAPLGGLSAAGKRDDDSDDDASAEPIVSPDKTYLMPRGSGGKTSSGAYQAKRTKAASSMGAKTAVGDHVGVSMNVEEILNSVSIDAMLPFSPLSTFLHPIEGGLGLPLASVAETIRLFQTALSGVVDALEKHVLPDLRSVRIRFASLQEAERAARALLADTESLAEQKADAAQKLLSIGSEKCHTVLSSMNELQKKQAQSIAAVMDLLEDAHNAEAAFTMTVRSLARLWPALSLHAVDWLRLHSQKIHTAVEAYADTILGDNAARLPLLPPKTRSSSGGVSPFPTELPSRKPVLSFASATQDDEGCANRPDQDDDLRTPVIGTPPGGPTSEDCFRHPSYSQRAMDESVSSNDDDDNSVILDSYPPHSLSQLHSNQQQRHSDRLQQHQRMRQQNDAVFLTPRSCGRNSSDSFNLPENGNGSAGSDLDDDDTTVACKAPLGGRSVRSLHSTFRPQPMPHRRLDGGQAEFRVHRLAAAAIAAAAASAGHGSGDLASESTESSSPLAQAGRNWQRVRQWVGHVADDQFPAEQNVQSVVSSERPPSLRGTIESSMSGIDLLVKLFTGDNTGGESAGVRR